ncbi:putative reverse transcriptase domain-containing protein [Tanacetum coccineum]|uniref:Reverse transcriptase domain-containing protein n=1 Tax=Tanacetum coccineum TaxID=301880 RepID=A0ABQ4Y2W5_9ASTR
MNRRSFRILKEKLCQCPVLARHMDKKTLCLFSEDTWRKNYTAHDLEVGAVLFALLKFGDIIFMEQKVLSTLTTRVSSTSSTRKSKENVVADALSRKERLKPRRERAMSITIHSGLKTKILEAQGEASKDLKAPTEWLRGLEIHFERREDGEIYFFDRIWIPSVGGVRKLIMDEALTSRYSIHLGADKMYHDLRDLYWWSGMKKDIAEHGVLVSIHFCHEWSIASPYGKALQEALGTKLKHGVRLPPEIVGRITMRALSERHSRPLYGKCIKDMVKGGKKSSDKAMLIRDVSIFEFEVGDRVLLKVSPWKGVVRFGKKGKLAPRYVGPFEIIERVGPVAYRLKLPQELSCVHDTFHVSNLKKCLAEPDVQVPLDEIEIDENLRFVEEPIEIVERDVKKLKRRRIPLVKVRWNSRQGAELYGEREVLRIMPPRRLKKKSVKRLMEKHVAKAIKEYEKSRANLDSAWIVSGETLGILEEL